jgi:hypothetical protein
VRVAAGGVCDHVINRGNGRREVFRKDGEYHAFLKAPEKMCASGITQGIQLDEAGWLGHKQNGLRQMRFGMRPKPI